MLKYVIWSMRVRTSGNAYFFVFLKLLWTLKIIFYHEGEYRYSSAREKAYSIITTLFFYCRVQNNMWLDQGAWLSFKRVHEFTNGAGEWGSDKKTNEKFWLNETKNFQCRYATYKIIRRAYRKRFYENWICNNFYYDKIHTPISPFVWSFCLNTYETNTNYLESDYTL